jgi:hypothetical protein
MSTYFDDDGRPYGVGNLSIEELERSIASIGVNVLITADIDEFITNWETPTVLYTKERHYIASLPCVDGPFVFDALGPENANKSLGWVNDEGYVNSTVYQNPLSSMCGVFCILVIQIWKQGMTRSKLESEIDKYLSHDTLQNEFNMTYYCCLSQFGEEFYRPDEYPKTNLITHLVQRGQKRKRSD